MYRDHPDEIIWPIRATNGLQGIFAYPKVLNQDSADREKTGNVNNLFKTAMGLPVSV